MRRQSYTVKLIGCMLVLTFAAMSLMAFSHRSLPSGILKNVVSPRKALTQLPGEMLQGAQDADGMINDKTQLTIDKGLQYLANRQAANGSFGTNRYSGNVAVTALCGLALMSGGNQPGRGKYGSHVTKAVEYILSREQKTDHLGRPTSGFLYQKTIFKKHGAMYEHGFGTLFLAEAYGMVYDPVLKQRLKDTLHRAVKLIIRSQNRDGGWRYTPFPNDADLSVTICQIMALRAARNSGVTVPANVIRKCIDYVKNCQRAHRGGAFQYMKHGGHVSMPLTAAGIVALYSAGEYKGETIESGLEYLKQYTGGRQPFGDQMYQIHFYYGHYYAAQAMWIAGGRYWKEWYPAIRDELLSRRNPDGSWFDGRICPHYCTAMSLIVLQMPNNYLPIFQR